MVAVKLVLSLFLVFVLLGGKCDTACGQTDNRGDNKIFHLYSPDVILSEITNPLRGYFV
jgi:hypothetical protein